MNAPPPRQVRLVIVGATGMVGGFALRYALDNPSVGAVTTIGRRTLGISHPKLRGVPRLCGLRCTCGRSRGRGRGDLLP